MVLTRKQLSIRPTQHGLLFLIILGAMMAGSINYNNNAGFILVFLLGGMGLISLIHSVRNLVGLEIGVASARPVFAGQPIPFTVLIQSRDRERVSLHLSLGGRAGSMITLPRGVSRDPVLTADTHTRGEMDPGPLTVSSVFPFGLFRLTARCGPGMSGLVYPAPVGGPVSSGRGSGGVDGTRDTPVTGPDDFQGLTPYSPGHDIKRMAWKAVSRGQGLFVKEFTARAGRFRIFDFDDIPSPDTEFRLSRLCELILTADRRQETYGLRLPGRKIDPAAGPTHRVRCLRALALFDGEAAVP